MSGANSHSFGSTKATMSTRITHGARTWRVPVAVSLPVRSARIPTPRTLSRVMCGIQNGGRPSRERYEPRHKVKRCLAVRAPRASTHLSDGALGAPLGLGGRGRVPRMRSGPLWGPRQEDVRPRSLADPGTSRQPGAGGSGGDFGAAPAFDPSGRQNDRPRATLTPGPLLLLLRLGGDEPDHPQQLHRRLGDLARGHLQDGAER